MSRLLPRLAALALLLSSAATAREGDNDLRFSSDGQVTTSFDIAGTPLTDQAQRVLVTANGRYIAVGYVSTGNVGLAAYKPDGSVDTTFGVSGKVAYTSALLAVTDATLDAVGRTVVVGYGIKPGGSWPDLDPVVCRYTASGQRDTGISATGCRSIAVDAVANGMDTPSAVTTDGAGQIYVAGQVQRGAEDYDFLVLKLSAADASPLSTFDGDGIRYIAFDVNANHGGGDVDGAQAILLQGTLLTIAGYAENEQGFDFALARISALDGSYDTTFCASSGVCSSSDVLGGKRTIGFDLGGTNDDRARALAQTADGKLIVAGEAMRVINGTAYNQYLVTRLNADGSFALPFGSSVAFYDDILPDLTVTGVAVQSDGKIVLAGDTAQTSGNVSPNRMLWVARLNANGTPDSGFATALGGGTSATTVIAFAKADDSQPLDHRGGALTLDHGRAVLAGSRLWRRDMANGIDDWDFAITRLEGDVIFTDGHEF